jgi:hypothetical protein
LRTTGTSRNGGVREQRRGARDQTKDKREIFHDDDDDGDIIAPPTTTTDNDHTTRAGV